MSWNLYLCLQNVNKVVSSALKNLIFRMRQCVLKRRRKSILDVICMDSTTLHDEIYINKTRNVRTVVQLLAWSF